MIIIITLQEMVDILLYIEFVDKKNANFICNEIKKIN